MNWSKIIKDLRNIMMLTQTELAEVLEVSFASINRWENGRYVQSIIIKRRIKDLCKKNNINLDSYSSN